MQSFRKQIAVMIAAGEKAIRVNTDEAPDAIAAILATCRKHNFELRVYDETLGVQWLHGQPKTAAPQRPQNRTGPAALEEVLNARRAPVPNILQTLTEYLHEIPTADPGSPGYATPTILVIKNMHIALERQRGSSAMPSVLQHLILDKIGSHPAFRQSHEAFESLGFGPDSTNGKYVIGLMPADVLLPSELAPLMAVIDHELPGEEELETILNATLFGYTLSAEAKKRARKFALGLTRLQAEGIFAMCVAQHGNKEDFATILPRFVWEAKSATLNKEGLVELYSGRETFENVGGLDGAKEFITRMLSPDEVNEHDPDVRARGILLVGGPGVGKSLIAKAAGNHLGLPALILNPGNLMGGLVGETESRTRKCFQIARAHAPCIVIIDEIEKVMPKSRGYQGDGGVGARMEGNFLTLLNDVQEPVFFCFTANDVETMHEAFFRAERVDAVFYVRLPGPKQRATIWRMYLEKFFPAEINGKPFPQHLELDIDALIAEGAPEPHEAAAALLAVPSNKRSKLVKKIRDADSERADQVLAAIVDDDGWTGAEIKACCRLSRLLKEPLIETAKRIRPVSVSAKDSFDRLETWALNTALDAETGQLFGMRQENDEAVPEQTGKIRRTVRTIG